MNSPHGLMATFAQFYIDNLEAGVLKGAVTKARSGGTPYLFIPPFATPTSETSFKVPTPDGYRVLPFILAFDEYSTGQWAMLSRITHPQTGEPWLPQETTHSPGWQRGTGRADRTVCGDLARRPASSDGKIYGSAPPTHDASVEPATNQEHGQPACPERPQTTCVRLTSRPGWTPH